MKYLLPFVLLMLSFSVSGQIRHIKGVNGIEVNYYLTTESGTGYAAYYTKWLKNKMYIKAGGLFLEQDVSSNLTHRVISAEAGLAYLIYEIGQTVYFNAIGGFTAGVESFVVGEGEVPEDIKELTGQNFKPGIWGGGEIEVYVADKLTVLLNAQQRYRFGADFGNTTFTFGGGLRYNF
jgi:hypothetical protein